MKVLLCPPIHNYRAFPTLLSFSDFPSGWGYIAAVLEQAGHQVYGLQLNNRIGYATGLALIKDKIPKAIEKVKPDLIGLGGICTDYAFLRDAINVIRETCSVPIVLGGRIVTQDKEIHDILQPDYSVIGAGENAILEILKGSFPQKGIVSAPPMPIDDIPFPNYEPFGVREMVDDYSMATRLLYRHSREYPRPFNIVTARGCPFSCTYCQHGDGVYATRSVDKIMDEIKVSYEKYKFNILIVLDELFVANKKRMKEFCEVLIRKKQEYGWDFDWMFQTHPNAHLDKECLMLAKSAGCYFFSYGLESASQRVLDSMNKKTTVAQAIEAVKLAEEVGIGFGGNLIFGDPAETEETISESLSVWYQHFRKAMVFLSYIQPYPGSKLFDYCVEKGLIKDKKHYYEHIDEGVFNMTTMDNQVFLSWINLLNTMEGAWLQVKTTKGTIEEDLDPPEKKYLAVTGAKMYKINTLCPYCGQETKYRNPISAGEKRPIIGTGCQKCGRRIRILCQ